MYVFSGQSAHAVDEALGWNLPAEHSEHTDAALAAPKVPGAHGSHTVAVPSLATEKVPGLQSTHVMGSVENLPDGHETHSTAPGDGATSPPEHPLHDDEPVCENEPASQTMAVEAPVPGTNWPLAADMHDVDPKPGANWPRKQSVQNGAPSVLENLPTGHRLHDVARSTSL